MMISRAPDVDVGRMEAEQAKIPCGAVAFRARLTGVGELRRPGSRRRGLPHETLVEIVRQLRRKRAAWSELRHQRRQQGLVAWNPLQHGVGEDNVEGPLPAPFANIRDLEGDVRKPLARRSYHVGRAVHADNMRSRVALA